MGLFCGPVFMLNGPKPAHIPARNSAKTRDRGPNGPVGPLLRTIDQGRGSDTQFPREQLCNRAAGTTVFGSEPAMRGNDENTVISGLKRTFRQSAETRRNPTNWVLQVSVTPAQSTSASAFSAASTASSWSASMYWIEEHLQFILSSTGRVGRGKSRFPAGNPGSQRENAGY